MNDVLLVVIPAVVGLATGAAATAYKSRKDLEVQYDIKLREERIAAYKELWKELDRLAFYSPPQALTHGVAAELATALRAWYFDIGGLLMSGRTREPYFDLQRALMQLAEAGGPDHEELEPGTGRALKALASRLRTSTTDDVATRVGSRLGGALRVWPPRVRPRARVTVTRGWQFEPEASPVWWVRVVNPSNAAPLTLASVQVRDQEAQAARGSAALPTRLLPRQEWRGLVPDPDGRLMDGVDPFGAAVARGDGWDERSRPSGDAPPSPNPG